MTCCSRVNKLTDLINNKMILKNSALLKSNATVLVWTITAVILLLKITWADCNLNTSDDQSFSLSTPEVSLGNNLDDCLLNTYILYDQRNFTGIPDNEQQLQLICSAFQRGFQCLDSYTNIRLTSDEQKIYRNKVDGIRKAMESLCEDSEFHTEYLKHGDCYKNLSNAWEACSTPLLTLMNNQEQTVSYTLHLCRAKQTFLDCITAEAQKQCDKEAAHFIRQLAETLSGTMNLCPRQISNTNRHEAKESGANELYSYLYFTLISTTMAILAT